MTSASSSCLSLLSESKSVSSTDYIFRVPLLEDCNEMCRITLESFNSFNLSVGLPLEWPTVSYCLTCLIENVQDINNKDCYGVLVVNPDKDPFNEDKNIQNKYIQLPPENTDNLGDSYVYGGAYLWHYDKIAFISTVFVNSHMKAKKIGKTMITQLLDNIKFHPEVTSIRLVQIGPNITSFSFYATLGFRCVAPLLHCEGSLKPSAIEKHEQLGNQLKRTIRVMTSADFLLCDEVFQYVNNCSRLKELKKQFYSQFQIDWHTVEKSGEIPEIVLNENNHINPDIRCYVIEEEKENGKKIVGYSTGVEEWNYTVTLDENAWFLLYNHLESKWKQVESIDICVHVMHIDHPEFVTNLINSGIKAVRQLTIMVKGEYTAPSKGIYTPSIEW